MISPAVDKAIKQLRKTTLTLEDRSALTAVLLDKVNALPLGNCIVLTEHGVRVNGRDLDIDQVLALKNSVEALKDNYAYKVLNEQIRYLAINLGVHNGLSLESIMFSKAALWCLQEEQKLINSLV